MNKTSNYQDEILIMGKGFALNVYLPAIASLGINKFALEVEAKTLINSNKKLKQIEKDIKWIERSEINKTKFSKIIIAEPPKKQFDLIVLESLWKNCDYFILEKPLAENVNKASLLLELLNSKKIKYLINYTFRYTNWYKRVSNNIKNNSHEEEIVIIWSFTGRHIHKQINSWKKNHFEGGGVIKYYGIHLIAILSDIGYTDIKKSEVIKKSDDNYISWACEFESTKKLPKLKLYIDSDSLSDKFFWLRNKKPILELDSPFSEESTELYSDRRIPLAINLLKDNYSEMLNLKNIRALNLWSKVEEQI